MKSNKAINIRQIKQKIYSHTHETEESAGRKWGPADDMKVATKFQLHLGSN